MLMTNLRHRALPLLVGALSLHAPGAHARESLGLYAAWGAFRDPITPRCYAIAMAEPSAQRREYQPYSAIGTWPRRAVRNQIHFRLSRAVAPRAPIVLAIADRTFILIGGGGDAWAQSNGDNAAIIAAMRSATAMRVSARDVQGRRFSNLWTLGGAASAMDAASIGCARRD
jgi:hypothetical protein